MHEPAKGRIIIIIIFFETTTISDQRSLKGFFPQILRVEKQPKVELSIILEESRVYTMYLHINLEDVNM